MVAKKVPYERNYISCLMHFSARTVTSIVIVTSGNASEYSTVFHLLVWNISLFFI